MDKLSEIWDANVILNVLINFKLIIWFIGNPQPGNNQPQVNNIRAVPNPVSNNANYSAYQGQGVRLGGN